MASRFHRDTAVQPIPGEPGAYAAHLDPAWHIVRGPNGGYLAAVLVRAMAHAVGDEQRQLRSLNVHYLRPPAAGPAHITATVERAGRTLSSVTARLEQEGRLQLIATAAFASGRGGAALHHASMPEVPPPEACERRISEGRVPMHDRYEQRWAIGPRFFDGESSREAVSGGWLRLTEPEPLSGALLAAYADAWPPAVFATSELGDTSGGVPTIDLTVHVRAPLPAGVADDDFVLVVFRTRTVSDGFLEEDGEIWSRDGRLLAHSRQLGLFL